MINCNIYFEFHPTKVGNEWNYNRSGQLMYFVNHSSVTLEDIKILIIYFYFVRVWLRLRPRPPESRRRRRRTDSRRYRQFQYNFYLDSHLIILSSVSDPLHFYADPLRKYGSGSDLKNKFKFFYKVFSVKNYVFCV